MAVELRRRKRSLNLYLREDLVEALAQVAEDSDLSISRVVEILLGLQFELNALVEKGQFLIELNKRFHRRSQVPASAPSDV